MEAIGGLPANETTLAEILLAQGYTTSMIGKWHLGQQAQFLPTQHGFQSYWGIPYSDDMGCSWWSPDAPASHCPRQPFWGSPLPILANDTIIEQPANLATLTQRYADRASAFITQQASSTKPWFLYMAFNHVHFPMFCSQPVCNETRRGPFGDNAKQMDDAVGQIMAALQTSNQDANTIVYFASDNGPWLLYGLDGGSAGLLRGGKDETWEGGIRVPAFVRWPGRIQPGMTLELGSMMDIFTTTVLLAGASLPTDRIIDGKDLSNVLFNGGTTPHQCLFHYKGTPMAIPINPANPPGLWAVRCGPYKAHYMTSGEADPLDPQPPTIQDPPLLYQIEYDPSEDYPISNTTAEYKAAMAIITAAKAAHEATLTVVPNQMALGSNASLAPCCDWDSQKKYPQWPACTCNPDNWTPFSNPEKWMVGDVPFANWDFVKWLS